MEESLKDVLLGCKLGEGLSREVYVNNLDEDFVVKIAKNGDYIYVAQNCIEYRIWECVIGSKIEKYFAPCEKISSDCKILIQKRTMQVSENEYFKFLKKKVPVFLNDIQLPNVGWYDGRIVVHDYGMFDFDKTLVSACDCCSSCK